MSKYTTISDEELAKRLRLGDELAFTEIYNRYWEKLLAISYHHRQDRQAAEDVVHDVLIGLWTRKAELTILSLQAYLATAVKFAVFKAIARERRRRDLLATNISSSDQYPPDIEDKLNARFLEEYVRGAVEELPSKSRLVFTYSRVEELSIKEIAQTLDLSPKAVEYHMTKALRSLRNALKKIKSFFF